MPLSSKTHEGILLGILEKGQHFFPLRAYYEDTDAGGIVYHANYLRYAERARAEMLRHLGIDRLELHNEGYIFVVRSMKIDYIAPGYLFDDLCVVSSVKKLTNSSINLSQIVKRNDGTTLADLNVIMVCVGTKQHKKRARRLPEPIRFKLEKFAENNAQNNAA